MSQMLIFMIKKNGDLEVFGTFDNAFRGWFLLWKWIGKKYMPIKQGDVSVFVKYMGDEKKMQIFWNLAYDEKVAEHHRTCLRASYDGAMIKTQTMHVASEAFKKIAGEMDDPGHMIAIGNYLDKASQLKDCLGACFQGTTTDSDSWNEGWIRDHGPRRPFNIYKDNNHGHAQYWIDPMNLDCDEESITPNKEEDEEE